MDHFWKDEKKLFGDVPYKRKKRKTDFGVEVADLNQTNVRREVVRRSWNFY